MASDIIECWRASA